MRPRFVILAIGLLVTAVGLGFGGFRLGHRLSTGVVNNPGDDLAWLRAEFKLSQEQVSQVRKLHEGYLPECREYCRQIAEGQRQLQQVLTSGAEPEVVEARLKEVALLRVQCQAAMLRHFREVSRAMPPEQGRRYLAEMQRLTLGSHETFEKSMSSGQSDPHEGHNH